MAEERGGNRDLPEELRNEILRRLPVKSLIRFESVCETWRSKFHSRGFIDLYGGRRRPRSYGGLVCNDDNPLGLHSIGSTSLREMGLWDPLLLASLNARTPDPSSKEHWVGQTQIFGLGPGNGIYCLVFVPVQKRRYISGIRWVQTALFNPATRDYRLADPFPAWVRGLLRPQKPSDELYVGFGKVGSSGYKIVVVVNHGDGSSFLCLVYSMVRGGGGCEWKKVLDYKRGRGRKKKKKNVGHRKAIEAFDRIFMLLPSHEACPRKLLEGCWHWAVVCNGESPSSSKSRYVLRFDFADESFKLMGAPKPEGGRLANARLRCEPLVLRGHLAFIYTYSLIVTSHVTVGPRVEEVHEWSVEEVHVWIMMRYGVEESWTRIYKIDPMFDGRFGYFYGLDECTPQPRGCTEEEEEEENGNENGVIKIERLFFQDQEDQDNIISISCDHDGGHKVHGRWNYRRKSFLNTPGVSTYVETLERL